MQVREVPLLFVPPTINKYYVLDISPGRSMIEHYVAQGQQVFAISWRNPEQAQGHFDLDTYAQAVAEARDAVASITAQPRRPRRRGVLGRDHHRGACSASSPRPASSTDVASLTLMVCALDNDTEGTMTALATRDVAAAAVAESARKGYLDGQALAGVFTWLRPNDLVWNYVVNNYLLGKDAAGVRHPLLEPGHGPAGGRAAPGLHPHRARQLVRPPGRARGARHARRPRQPSTSTRTSSPALNDHIVPWESAYAARCCSAATGGSCSRAAATSRRSSTRRARTAESELPRRRRAAERRPRSSWPRRRSCREAGGRTGTRGWPSAPAR